ncbi:MAG: hypothetical protein AAFP97_06310 [Pseudomonadota bacterium]
MSRLSIVASDETYDYGLTTAHSMMDQSNCTVSDDGHDRKSVLAHRLSPSYDPEVPTSAFEDWSVIKFKSFDRPGVYRFNIQEAVGGDETIKTAFIPRGRGRLVNEKPCSINYRDARVPPLGDRVAYPTHDCRTQGGQSGTPMTVVGDDGTLGLFGINTGRTFFYSEWNGQGPRWYGRFIPLTPDRITAIQAELNELRVEE